MKTMTCKGLGGPCDQKLSAGSWDEMVQTMGRLRDDPAERERLAREAHRLIVGGHNTYQDRLLAMLEPTAVGMTAALGRS